MQNKEFQKANTLSILSANCLNQRSSFSSCHICETVCPQQSLSFSDGTWTAINCSLCGVCAMVCPTQVFQIDMPALLNQPQQDLILCCSQNASVPSEALRLNCIQQLNPLAIIHLLYRHNTLTLYLPIEQCKQCTHQWYVQGLLQQLNTYQLPSDKLKIIIQETPVSESANQRRELLRDLFHRTEEKSKKALTTVVEKISTDFTSQELVQKEPAVFPARLPLYALYIKKEIPLPAEHQLPFRKLHCTSCTFCGACMHICPTQAISINTEDTIKELHFRPELCINCNLCQIICIQHGLEWDDYLTTEQFIQSPISLAHSKEQICNLCEHEFYQWPPSKEDRSPICSFCK